MHVLIIHFVKMWRPLNKISKKGIYRMKQFYETYQDYPQIVSTVLTQLSWSNHLKILSSTKTIEEKEFYINLAIKEKYPTRQLSRQIDSAFVVIKINIKRKYKNFKHDILMSYLKLQYYNFS